MADMASDTGSNDFKTPFSDILSFISNGITEFLNTVVQIIPACRDGGQNSLDKSSDSFQHAIELFANNAS